MRIQVLIFNQNFDFVSAWIGLGVFFAFVSVTHLVWKKSAVITRYRLPWAEAPLWMFHLLYHMQQPRVKSPSEEMQHLCEARYKQCVEFVISILGEAAYIGYLILVRVILVFGITMLKRNNLMLVMWFLSNPRNPIVNCFIYSSSVVLLLHHHQCMIAGYLTLFSPYFYIFIKSSSHVSPYIAFRIFRQWNSWCCSSGSSEGECDGNQYKGLYCPAFWVLSLGGPAKLIKLVNLPTSFLLDQTVPSLYSLLSLLAEYGNWRKIRQKLLFPVKLAVPLLKIEGVPLPEPKAADIDGLVVELLGCSLDVDIVIGCRHCNRQAVCCSEHSELPLVGEVEFGADHVVMVGEPYLSNQIEPSTTPQGDYADHLESPKNVPDNSSNIEANISSTSLHEYDESK